MRKIAFIIMLLAGVSVTAGEKQYLWPKDKMPHRQAGQIAAPTNVAEAQGFDRAAWTEPYLEWNEKPAKPNGTCVVLISGGGYYCWCDVGLIEAWRKEYTAAGCQTVSLVYRTPRPEGLAYYQSAWEDGQRAIRLVRAAAKKRGFDPEKIGVVGMSAGSHLSVLLASSSQTAAYEPIDENDKLSCHIAFALPFAPAYVLDDGLGIANSRDGDAIDVKLDSIFKFDAKTAPMCLSHGGCDPYSPNGSTAIYRQLRKMNIRAEVHLYPDMPHGCFGIPRTTEFLRQMGFLGEIQPEEDLEKRFEQVGKQVVKSEKVMLWGEEGSDRGWPYREERQCVPYLEWYVPEKLTTKAIQIIWSGGAYEWNGPDGFEVAPMRKYLNDKGMAVVTVKYRVPRPLPPLAKHTTAWQDAQRAIRIVRHGAAARGLDPNRIGVMGSSAGGHLALMCATSSQRRAYNPWGEIDKETCEAQWAIAIYPAYVLEDGADGENKRWGNDDDERIVRDFSFDFKTCPTLFIHGDTDGYSAMGSVRCWEQMRRMGVQSEVHTLATRRHCLQRQASPGTGSYTWCDRAWEFLSSKGFNK